ncbi:MAG: TetR/AcrR family transcriptional regulator [Planctomycetota bacterium]
MAAGDRKEEIRRRAAEVFAAKGFDRASIRGVAKAAKMSLAGLYYYYRGKDEILFDIQRTAFQTLLDAHADALAGVRDPSEKLRRVIAAHLSFFAHNIAEMKVMSRESETLTGEYADQVGEMKRRYVRLVRGIVEELGRERPLKSVDPAIAAFLLFGMMNWMYTWYDPQRDGSAAELARAMHEVFLGGVLR